MHKFLLLLASVLLFACGGVPKKDGEPMVSGAWVRLAPPSATVLAGYMTLSNLSSEDLRVVAATSELFERVEFHHMKIEDGQMFMQEMAGIEAPAHQMAKLEPGGNHLMLIQPARPVVAGERLVVNLSVEQGLEQFELPVTFVVRSRAPQ